MKIKRLYKNFEKNDNRKNKNDKIRFYTSKKFLETKLKFTKKDEVEINGENRRIKFKKKIDTAWFQWGNIHFVFHYKNNLDITHEIENDYKHTVINDLPYIVEVEEVKDNKFLINFYTQFNTKRFCYLEINKSDLKNEILEFEKSTVNVFFDNIKNLKIKNLKSDSNTDEFKSLKELLKNKIQANEDQIIQDKKTQEEINNTNLSKVDNFNFVLEPKPKNNKTDKKTKTYIRNKNLSIDALQKANFKCEADCNYKTFLRKKDNLPYLETHHLIPLKYSDDFEYSLDNSGNIVSLCSNCHNLIHYGKDINIIIKKLFEKRKEDLKKCGTYISIEDLLAYYN